MYKKNIMVYCNLMTALTAIMASPHHSVPKDDVPKIFPDNTSEIQKVDEVVIQIPKNRSERRRLARNK